MLQSLQGNGEDGYKAERAFYHYMGDVQKTKDHLAAAKQVNIFFVHESSSSVASLSFLNLYAMFGIKCCHYSI